MRTYSFLYKLYAMQIRWRVPVAIVEVLEGTDYNKDLALLTSSDMKIDQHVKIFSREGTENYRLVGVILQGIKQVANEDFRKDIAYYLSQTTSFNKNNVLISGPKEEVTAEQIERIIHIDKIYVRVPSHYTTRVIFHERYKEGYFDLSDIKEYEVVWS